MKTITAKQLHQETKAILNQLELGESMVLTRNGRRIGRIEPYPTAQAPSDWAEVMGQVWQAQKSVKASERTVNPVLQERHRRRR